MFTFRNNVKYNLHGQMNVSALGDGKERNDKVNSERAIYTIYIDLHLLPY